MPKGGGGRNFFGGGKRPKAGGGSNVHHNSGPGKENVKPKVTPVRQDGAGKPGLLRRMSTGLFGPSGRIPKTGATADQQRLDQQQRLKQQRRLEEQRLLEQQKVQGRLEHQHLQPQQQKQGHQLSPEFTKPIRVEAAQQRNQANPQFGQQNFNHLSPHRADYDHVHGWVGGQSGQHPDHNRRHSAEPLKYRDWDHHGLMPAIQPVPDRGQNVRLDPHHLAPQHDQVNKGGRVLPPQGPTHPQNVQQNHQHPANGSHTSLQRPAGVAKKSAVQVVAPPTERGGKIVQRVKIPSYVAAGATAAGTALVEQVLTKAGNVIGENFLGWWNGDDEKPNKVNSHQDNKLDDNANKPGAPTVTQEPNPQQPHIQQPFVTTGQQHQPQPSIQQPAPQQPGLQQSASQQPSPVASQQHPTPPTAGQIYYVPPGNAAQNGNSSNSLPNYEGPKFHLERPNVGAGDELILPRHFPLYPYTIVSWYDGSSDWQEDYLFFTSWNTTTSKSVLTFVAKKFVTAGHEHLGVHFRNMYPQLWRDPEAKKNRGGECL